MAKTVVKPAPAKAAPPPPKGSGPVAVAPVPKVMPSNTAGVAIADDFDKAMRADAGMGVSTRASDNITPSIAVLQPLSPAVLAGPEKISNAEAGDFLLTNASNPIIKGGEGFWFQPVCMTEWWFEFIPRDRGGGFVARYPVRYDDEDQVVPPQGAEQDANLPYRFTFTETNNNCIHYRFVPGIMWENGVGLEYVIPFHGTGHTVAKGWNTRMNRKRSQDGTMWPAFSHVYQLTTVQKQNKHGTWFQIEVSNGTMLNEATLIVGDEYMRAYDMGKSLALAFKAGSRVEGVVQDSNGAGKSEDDIPY